MERLPKSATKPSESASANRATTDRAATDAGLDFSATPTVARATARTSAALPACAAPTANAPVCPTFPEELVTSVLLATTNSQNVSVSKSLKIKFIA